MMRKKVLFMILAAFIIVFACEDDNENGDAEFCYLTKLIDENGNIEEYIYSTDLKLERINLDATHYISFEYTADKITKIQQYEQNVVEMSSEITWTGNEISNLKLYIRNSGNVMELWSTQVFTYTSGKLTSISATNANDVVAEISYTWSGNNIETMTQSIENEMSINTYQYDNKRNICDGFSSYYPYAIMSPHMTSENNVTVSTETNESGEVMNIETSTYTYNNNDYPVTITAENNEIGQQIETSSTTIEYDCI